MELFTSQAAESEVAAATNQEKRAILITKLIAGLKHYEQNPDDAAKAVISAKDAEISELKSQLTEALQGKDDAESAAQEAIDFANSKGSNAAQELTVTLAGKKYKIVFGVDGLTKEQLKDDTELCASLVKKGSAALVLQEGK